MVDQVAVTEGGLVVDLEVEDWVEEVMVEGKVVETAEGKVVEDSVEEEMVVEVTEAEL